MTRPTASPAPDRRNVLLVAGVVILAVVVSLLAFAVLRSEPETAEPGSPSEPASPSVPPSQAPSPSEAPSAPPPSEGPAPTPVAAPDEWTLVHMLGPAGTRWVGGEIAYGDAGFLAIGRRWEGGEGGPRITENVMWLSVDGRDWIEVDYPLAATGNYDVMELFGAADGSYVMHALTGGQEGHPWVSVSLRSTDGTTWEVIETGLPDDIAVGTIAMGPSGYLLTGDQTRSTDGSGNPSLWLSADGLSWELVHEFSQEVEYVQLDDADGGEDGYVVIGRRIDPDGPHRRFAFASADGREWVERAAPFGPEAQDFVGDSAVSSLGPDWVATLSERDQTTSTFTSSDGLTWTKSGSIPMSNLNVADAGLLAELTGELLSSSGGGIYFDGTPGVFSSTDGASWSPVDMGADAWLNSLAIGDGLVAVSGTMPGADFATAAGIWIRATD